MFSENQENGEDNKLSPKELILLIIAHRTKTFLDVAGEKLHYMEPDSLRNLNDLFYLFYNMNDIDSYTENNDSYYRDLEANRKVLLNYLYFKMIPEFNLSTEEEQTLKEFARDRLYRKGRRIWDYYYKRFTKEDEKTRIERLYGAKFYNDEILKNRVEYYSFGELFRVLYFGSRLNLMSREFIQAILASFSFIMPQFIETEKYYEKKCEEEKNKNKGDKKTADSDLQSNDDGYKYKPIRDVFRYTLLGTWCEDLFAKRTVDIVVRKHSINDEKSIKKFLYFLMLTPVSTGESIKAREDDGKIRISAKLDPTALFMNMVRIKRLNGLKFKHLGNEHIIDFKKFISDIIVEEQPQDESLKKVIESLEKNSDLLETLFGDEQKTNGLKMSWFLLKNIDITYNVIKRVVIYLIYLSDNNLRDKKTPKSTPEEAIHSFYFQFEKKLREEYDVYNKNNLLDWNFYEAFSYNPVIKLFLDKKNPVSKEIGKESEKNIYIDWGDSEQMPSIGDVSLNTMFEMCSESCPTGISTLKRLYNSSLNENISRQNATEIIALILDNKLGEAVMEISKSLNNKGGAAT